MKIEVVEVISKLIIKPSSPTAANLRHYQLSFLDQLAPPIYMPLVLFFTQESPLSPPPHFRRAEDICNDLKRSLSHVLTRFYSLAGRVKNNDYVDCNDEGAHFFEAKVKGRLAKYIANPELAGLNKLLPYEIDDVDELALAVQVNFFDCGGMAIGLCVSHKVADALSLCMFLKSWSAAARGDFDDVVKPRFDAAKLFPPKSISGFNPATGIVKDDLVLKRFVFNASKILSLREKYAEGATVEVFPRRPTRVEALSTLVWSRYMAATQCGEDNKNKIYTVLHAVNLRPKADPPLPENAFGNISRIAIAIPNLESDEEGYGVWNDMRSAISSVDTGFFKQLGQEQNESHLKFIKERAEKFKRGEMVSFSFTSLYRFPLYEAADFGWGKPVWVTPATMSFKNLVSFMDTKEGDGIEAWIVLKREDMNKFEVDEELLSYASTASRPSTSNDPIS